MTPLLKRKTAILCCATVISTLHKKANKVLQRWRVLSFYRIAPCLKDNGPEGRLKDTGKGTSEIPGRGLKRKPGSLYTVLF